MSKRYRVTSARPVRRPRNASRGGRSHSPEYGSWYSANVRCSRAGSPGWAAYGGRGIRVCDRWAWPDGFERFLADMGPRPDGMSLDRIDVNGNYEPGNCRWADAETQQSNKRPYTRERREARDRILRTFRLPGILERIEEKMLRDIGSALRAEFGPVRNPDAVASADYQISDAVVSGYEFRGLNVRAA